MNIVKKGLENKMNVSLELKQYIEKNIYPLYEKNYIGDGLDRLKYVTNRCEEIIAENSLKIDDDILYTAISFHDIRINNVEEEHELISADIMYNDEFLKKFFDEEKRKIIKEAIEDQRANSINEPRNIYGKILSSASRNSSVEQSLERSYKYGKKKNPNKTDEEIFLGSYDALAKKFGENGYAQFYFKDKKYEEFLKEIRDLLKNKDSFINTQRNYIDKLKKEKKI